MSPPAETRIPRPRRRRAQIPIAFRPLKRQKRTAAQIEQDERWDRIYRERFEDPTYYGVHIVCRSPQADF